MTVKTWKEEFYPIPADQATDTELEAIEHSLRKWRGLTKENRAKHGLTLNDFVAYNSCSLIVINGSTCSLCKRHTVPLSFLTECSQCSITAITGTPCDKSGGSPWSMWRFQNDPRPMISVLEQCLEEEKERAGV